MADLFGALSVPPNPANVSPVAWAATTAYAAGAFVTPTGAAPATSRGFFFAASGAGTSGASEPTWPTTIGGTVADNGITWTCVGQSPAPGGDLAADPFLQVLLSYLGTALPATLAPVFHAPGVAPNRDIVLRTFAWDPSKRGFVDTKLPALYAWRGQDVEEKWLAADYRLDTERATLLYVFEPTANPEAEKTRDTLGNAIRKQVISLLVEGRHPSWVVPWDTDASAATLGSVAAVFGGWFDLQVGKGQLGQLRVQTGGKPQEYVTWECELFLRERQIRGVSQYPIQTSFDVTTSSAQTDQDQNAIVIGESTPTDPSPWAASTSYDNGTVVVPSVANGFLYQASGFFTSDASEPAWPTIVGGTVLDGDGIWTCLVQLTPP